MINRMGTKRRIGLYVGGPLAAGLMLTGVMWVGAIAHAGVIEPARIQIHNVATGMCLDGDGNLYTHDCNDGAYQKWLEFRNDWGYKSLMHIRTGKCVSIKDDANGSLAYLGYCTEREAWWTPDTHKIDSGMRFN